MASATVPLFIKLIPILILYIKRKLQCRVLFQVLNIFSIKIKRDGLHLSSQSSLLLNEHIVSGSSVCVASSSFPFLTLKQKNHTALLQDSQNALHPFWNIPYSNILPHHIMANISMTELLGAMAWYAKRERTGMLFKISREAKEWEKKDLRNTNIFLLFSVMWGYSLSWNHISASQSNSLAL